MVREAGTDVRGIGIGQTISDKIRYATGMSILKVFKLRNTSTKPKRPVANRARW